MGNAKTEIIYRDKQKIYSHSFNNVIWDKLKDKRNLKILDIGCHTGKLGHCLKQNNNVVYGIDISSTAISIASRCLNKAWCIDIENDPAPINERDFDIIIFGKDISKYKKYKVVFSTKCWENDWEILLKQKFIKEIIARNNFSFDKKIVLINNVNDKNEVSRYAKICKDKGIIDAYYFVNDYADDVLKYFNISKESFGKG